MCADNLLTSIQKDPAFVDRTLLSMRALVRIYFRMAQKVDYERNIKEIRTDIFMKGRSLADHTLQCSSLIQRYSEPHLREGMTILIHSYSRVVLNVIQHACERGLKLKVITTEAQPSHTSKQVADACEKMGIECQEIYDTAVAVSMPLIDCVCIGCEAVLANGGIINKIGTYGISLIASHF